MPYSAHTERLDFKPQTSDWRWNRSLKWYNMKPPKRTVASRCGLPLNVLCIIHCNPDYIWVCMHPHTHTPTQLQARGEAVPEDKRKPYLTEPGDRPVTNCTIFLGYTSNLISSGIRDTLRYLVQHNMVRPKGFPGSLSLVMELGPLSLSPVMELGPLSLSPVMELGPLSLSPVMEPCVCIHVFGLYTRLCLGGLPIWTGFTPHPHTSLPVIVWYWRVLWVPLVLQSIYQSQVCFLLPIYL